MPIIQLTLSYAQTPDFAPWCPSGATWIYRYNMIWGKSYTKFQFEKDTVINQIAVKKINVYNLDYSYEPLISKMYTTYQYLSNDSMYKYNPQSNSFIFMYKFNVLLGEEIVLQDLPSCPNHSYPQTDTFTVTQIGFDTIQGVVYSYAIYQSNSGNFELGKVRNNWGGISMPSPVISTNCPSQLVSSYLGLSCYYDDIRGFVNSSFSDSICNKLHTLDIKNFTTKPKASQTIFSIYPNPSSSNFSIKIHSNFIHWEDIQGIQLIDAQGKYIPLPSIAQNVFPIEHLASGLYVVEIQYKNGIERVKLIR